MTDSFSFEDALFSILTGIISILIVLALQVFVEPLSQEVHLWIKRIKLYSPLWGFLNSREVCIVSASLLLKTPTQLLMPASMRTPTLPSMPALTEPDEVPVNEIVTTLRVLRPKLKFERFYAHSIPEEFVKKDIITVGGPVYNHITEQFMKPIEKLVTFEKQIVGNNENVFYFYLHDHISNKDYRPSYYPNNLLSDDYGIILKIPNPYSNYHNVLMFMGCDSHGVLAAVRSISFNIEAEILAKKIRQKLTVKDREKFYMCIVSCKAIGHDVGKLTIEDIHILNDTLNPMN